VVLHRRVVEGHVDDHAHAEGAGAAHEVLELRLAAQLGVDRIVVAHVVTIVAARRVEERPQPHAGDAEVGEVVEL